MRRRMTNGLIVMAILLGGCASRAPQASRAEQPAAAAEPQGPVIVHLVGQHQTITVTSGPDGPLYSAKTEDGQPIVANASLEQLREGYLAVYQFVEPSIAVHADVGSAVPDRSRTGAFPKRTEGSRSEGVLLLDNAAR